MQLMHVFLIVAFIIAVILWVYDDYVCENAYKDYSDDFNENEGEEWLKNHEGWM